jgi:O-antigen/teichoic acid export membrane protein
MRAVLSVDCTKAYKRLAPTSLSWETFRTGLATVIDQAIVSGTSFCVSIMIGRRCSKEELGLYVLGMSIVLFVTGLQNSFITMPYIVYSPRADGKVDSQYAGSTLIHEAGLSILAIITMLIIARAGLYRIGVPGLGRVVWVLASVVTFILLREYARRMCFAWLQAGNAIAMDLLAGIIQIGGLLFLSRHGLLSAISAYWVIGSACGLAAIWWLVSRRQNFDVRLSRVGTDLSHNWSFGKWMFAGGFVYMASSQLYPWFLAGLYGTNATGTYAACLGVVLFANPLLMGCSNYLGPKAAHSFARGGIARLRSVVYKATFVISALMVVFAAGILIVGGQLVVAIYGPQYAGNGPVISVLVLSILAGAVALGFDAGLYAMNRPTAIFQATLLGLGATVCFGFWMAKYYGPLGAAYGLLAASIITGASKCFSFWRLSSNGTASETVHGFPGAEIARAQSVSISNTEAEG